MLRDISEDVPLPTKRLHLLIRTRYVTEAFSLTSFTNLYIVVKLVDITAVRLNVEKNQLVNVFGKFGICFGSLKGA